MESLHEQIGIVTQENFLFTGTVMENLKFGRPEASDDDVVEELGTRCQQLERDGAAERDVAQEYVDHAGNQQGADGDPAKGDEPAWAEEDLPPRGELSDLTDEPDSDRESARDRSETEDAREKPERPHPKDDRPERAAPTV